MLERLADLEREFDEVEARFADPAVIADRSRYEDVARRYKELEAIVSRYRDLVQRTADLETASEMLKDASGGDRDIVREEVDEAEADIARLDAELRLLLLPKDPNEGKNVILEIRGAEGGEEANLFARDLFQMYQGYAGRMGWGLELLNTDHSDMGGFNEVVFLLKGEGVWPRMKHEGGPHRVQRVPVTESHATGAGHREPGPDPHLVGDGHRAAGGRGGRGRHRPERPADRRLPLVGSRRSVRQHH
jgi:peptide chain release factor 1